MIPRKPKRYDWSKRRRINPMSAKRRAQSITYATKRKFFLIAHPFCAWGLRQAPPISIRSEEVHHSRGKSGNLYLDERYWLAVSAIGHDEIHNHPEEARKLGLLCAKGKWGCQT